MRDNLMIVTVIVCFLTFIILFVNLFMINDIHNQTSIEYNPIDYKSQNESYKRCIDKIQKFDWYDFFVEQITKRFDKISKSESDLLIFAEIHRRIDLCLEQ